MPPDLDHLAQAGTAAEMFWIISNGIRMTGMPAFSKTHQPDEIWPVVAFLQSAGSLGTDDYTRLKNKAQGFGHHSPESAAHDEGNGRHIHDASAGEHDETAAAADENNQDDVTLPSVENTNKHSHNDESKHDHGHH